MQRRQLQKATAKTEADPYGMTNKKGNDNSNGGGKTATTAANGSGNVAKVYFV
jgi:hypothetical protein